MQSSFKINSKLMGSSEPERTEKLSPELEREMAQSVGGKGVRASDRGC